MDHINWLVQDTTDINQTCDRIVVLVLCHRDHVKGLKALQIHLPLLKSRSHFHDLLRVCATKVQRPDQIVRESSLTDIGQVKQRLCNFSWCVSDTKHLQTLFNGN